MEGKQVAAVNHPSSFPGAIHISIAPDLQGSDGTSKHFSLMELTRHKCGPFSLFSLLDHIDFKSSNIILSTFNSFLLSEKLELSCLKTWNIQILLPLQMPDGNFYPVSSPTLPLLSWDSQNFCLLGSASYFQGTLHEFYYSVQFLPEPVLNCSLTNPHKVNIMGTNRMSSYLPQAVSYVTYSTEHLSEMCWTLSPIKSQGDMLLEPFYSIFLRRNNARNCQKSTLLRRNLSVRLCVSPVKKCS